MHDTYENGFMKNVVAVNSNHCIKTADSAIMQMLPSVELLRHIKHIKSNKNKIHKPCMQCKCAEMCRNMS